MSASGQGINPVGLKAVGQPLKGDAAHHAARVERITFGKGAGLGFATGLKHAEIADSFALVVPQGRSGQYPGKTIPARCNPGTVQGAQRIAPGRAGMSSPS